LPEQLWFNALWFQLTWFSAVLGREDWIYLTAAMIGLHLLLVRRPLPECYRLLPLAMLGVVTDCLLSYSGVFQFETSGLIPLWLCAVWLAFATTLTRSLKFLRDRLWLASLLGATAAPLNYGAGQRLGAVEFGYPLLPTMALLALIWALLLPALSWAADHLSQTSSRQMSL